MAEHVICITANAGLPLLTRSKPGCPPMTFPFIGSLYGVHMFGSNQGASLQSTVTVHHRVVWKTYHESIVLIVVAPNEDRKSKNQPVTNRRESDSALELQQSSRNLTSTVPDDHLFRLADNIFNALVMLIGIDDLVKFRSIDHLKKALKSSYHIIDSFLESDTVMKKNENCPLFGDLTQCVDVAVNTEAKFLEKEHLQEFAKAAGSKYGCLVVDGRLLCATESWWLLDGQELALLSRLISLFPPSVTASDIPVFLPNVSPAIPHRLVMLTLIVRPRGGVRVCVLCGPEPSLMEIKERFVQSFWGPVTNNLQRCCTPTSIPDATASLLPSDLLAFLLVDIEINRCLSYFTPPGGKEIVNRRKQQKSTSDYEPSWLYDKLVEFYKCVVGTSFPFPENEDDTSHDSTPHAGIAHYRCLRRHKCFALVKSQYQLFALYSKETPTYAMQGLTERILKVLSKDDLL
ncbi:unnamed protein product [Clavelina lepadiformis]|uniref:Fuzzy n=1 Tax=Clavelina lepadiformis TaxID=159417 RepID=A0ABP0GKW3_CLALP